MSLAIPESTSPLERGYRQSISIHYPNIDPLEMATRVKLMRWRDRLGAALARCTNRDSEDAIALALRMAANYALSVNDTPTLMRIDAAIYAMFEAARMIERAR